MANKRGYELDTRVQKVIDDVFADFEVYLPCIQDVQMYRRKRLEYWDKIIVRLREEITDGRPDNPAGNTTGNA